MVRTVTEKDLIHKIERFPPFSQLVVFNEKKSASGFLAPAAIAVAARSNHTTQQYRNDQRLQQGDDHQRIETKQSPPSRSRDGAATQVQDSRSCLRLRPVIAPGSGTE